MCVYTPPRIVWTLGPGEADLTVQNFDLCALNSRFKTNAARALFKPTNSLHNGFRAELVRIIYATACAAHTHHGRVCERRKK